MTATKVIAIVMAAGVVASGIYGMTQAGPHLVKQTVGTLDTLKVQSRLGTGPPHDSRLVVRQGFLFGQPMPTSGMWPDVLVLLCSCYKPRDKRLCKSVPALCTDGSKYMIGGLVEHACDCRAPVM